MTTGSLIQGTVDGMALGVSEVTGKVVQIVDGTPAGKLTVSVVSGLAYDRTNGTYYMALGALDSTTWIVLGSVSA